MDREGGARAPPPREIGVGKVEIGDLGLDSGNPSGAAPQRSLVSSSLLRTGETARVRGSSH